MRDLRRFALLLIDLQVAMAQAPWPRNNPAAEAQAQRLLAAWRRQQGLVVHVRHIGRAPSSVFTPGTSAIDFQPAFRPLSHEPVVEKSVPDAFARSGLERSLRLRGAAGVVLVGVATHNSIESTARAAACHGVPVVVVSDATFTFEKVDHDGRLRSAQEVHAMSLANLAGEYADVVPTERVLEGLACAPQAKALPTVNRP